MESPKTFGDNALLLDVEPLVGADSSLLAHAVAARVVASCGVAVIGYRIDGRIFEWNDEARNLFGYAGADAIGATITQLGIDRLIDQSDQPRAGHRCAEPLLDHPAQYTCGDLTLHLTISRYPLVGTEGQIIGWCLIAKATVDPAEDALLEYQRLLDHAERLAGVGAWSYDAVTGSVYWSDQLCRMLDVPLKHQRSFEEALSFPPEGRQVLRDMTIGSAEQRVPHDLEMQLTTASGRQVWIRLATAPEVKDGVARRVYGAVQDITARKEAERALASQNSLLRTTLDSIGDAVITTDPAGRVRWLNPVASTLTGWALPEVQGRYINEIFRVVNEDGSRPPTDPIQRACRGPASLASEQMLLIDRQGRERSIIDSAAPIRDESGGISGYVMVFHDVSEQRRLVQEVNHRATHDSLTGLANRTEFELRLSRAFTQVCDDGSMYVLLYVDLDQFKIVNDTCGHSAGDQLLRTVAKLFTTCIGTNDVLARLGGDEFGVLLSKQTLSSARKVAEQLCDQLDRYRFVHAGDRFRIGASIGMVPVDRRWSSEAEILRAADGACYAAKEEGRNRVHEWSESDTRVLARQHEMQWASQIERGLDEDRFCLYAQKMVGCSSPLPNWHIEILLRLSTQEGRLIGPGAFFPAAERFNLASRIDRWVLREVIAFMTKHDCRMLDTIGINLSGQSIGDKSFHRYAMELIRDSGVDARKLCFEITETAAITYMGDASDFISSMRALGARLALDDFGSGISSFGYLKALPLDFLKIDRSFVQGILQERLDHVAVSSFCSAAKACGLRTIAEGIENEEVMAELRRIGVDMAQGMLFHRPEPLLQLMAKLRQ